MLTIVHIVQHVFNATSETLKQVQLSWHIAAQVCCLIGCLCGGRGQMPKKTDEPKVIFVTPPEESEDDELDRVAGKDPQRRTAVRHWRSLHQYVNGRAGKLEEFTLEGPNMQDEHLKGLELFPEVISVGFVEAGVTDAGVAFLEKCPNLEIVDIFRCAKVTDSVCKTLGGLRRLVKLNLSGSPIGDRCIAHLPSFPKLTRLELDETQITSVSLEYAARLPALVCLWAGHTDIDDAGLRHLGDLTTLRDILLNSTRITDDGFAHLAKLTRLSQLSLRDTQVSDKSMLIIGTFDDMHSLDVQRTRLTNTGVASLVGLKKLRNLWLDGTGVDDACVPDLLGMQSLKVLGLTKTNLSKAGIDQLRAGLQCRIHSDYDAVKD